MHGSDHPQRHRPAGRRCVPRLCCLRGSTSCCPGEWLLGAYTLFIDVVVSCSPLLHSCPVCFNGPSFPLQLAVILYFRVPTELEFTSVRGRPMPPICVVAALLTTCMLSTLLFGPDLRCGAFARADALDRLRAPVARRGGQRRLLLVRSHLQISQGWSVWASGAVVLPGRIQTFASAGLVHGLLSRPVLFVARLRPEHRLHPDQHGEDAIPPRLALIVDGCWFQNRVLETIRRTPIANRIHGA